MADVSKLKLAMGQIELVEGQPSRNEAACDAMIDRALDAGADALVVPNSLVDESNVRIIGLNDSRIDVAGNVVVLDACGETFRIGLGEKVKDCDFTVQSDLSPYLIEEIPTDKKKAGIVIRPVGIREAGSKVFAYNGGSKVFNTAGETLMSLRSDFNEDFCLVDFTGGKANYAAPKATLVDVLVESIKRFDNQVLPFGPCWVVGLSGGLDSSVTAALLTLAVGPDRVMSYNMATRYNSPTTRSNAAKLSEGLGIALKNGSIEGLVVSMGNTLFEYGYPQDALKGLILENVQARTRGGLLQTFAAVENGVVVNNGNRVECALGYATLYGDAIGAFAPIADLTKVQLFDVAHQINERFGREVIPHNLLPSIEDGELEWEMPPSAELSSGQRDPMKWFYHDWLIGQLLGDGKECALPLYDAACEIMTHYEETRFSDTPVNTWVNYYGLDDPAAFVKDLEWVIGSMRGSVFKRIQAPPKLVIASRASVNSKPESQTNLEPPTYYNALIRRIASLKA